MTDPEGLAVGDTRPTIRATDDDGRETWFDAEVIATESIESRYGSDGGFRWQITLEGGRWPVVPQLGAKVNLVLTSEAPRFFAHGGEIFDNQAGDVAALVGTFGEADLAARVAEMMNRDEQRS